MSERLRALLAHRLAPVGSVVLGLVLALPALRVGLLGDDYFQRMVLLGRGPLGAQLDATRDLFSFVTDRQRPMLMDLGILPWWSDPGLRLALGRPLTALTHRLDYALWPDDFVLQHLHSLVWFGLALGLVATLYRRVHGAAAVAGLAGLLFAVEDAHAFPAGWLANRNALVCLVFGTGVILLHLAWRQSGGRSARWCALLALALGLGAGEATLGALAYVAAWEIAVERGSWRDRLLALVPYGLVVALWRVLYGRAGYGTLQSVLYLDPGGQPLDFLAALPERFTLLLAAQWFSLPADLWMGLPRVAQLVLAGTAVLLCAALLVLLRPLLAHQRLARFWLLGMALSLVPVCAAFPMDRLLIFAGVGAFGALALLAEDTAAWPWPREPGQPRRWRRAAVGLLLVLHLPVAAILLAGKIGLLPLFGQFFADGTLQAPRGPEVPRQTFVFVNGNDFPVAYTWIIRTVEEPLACPRRVVQLSSAMTHNQVRREDARTLLVSSAGGFLEWRLDRLMAATRSFVVGQRIARPDYVAEIRSITADGRPLTVAFQFERALEDPSYRWLHWEHGRVRELALPRVGEAVTVTGPLWE